MNGPLHQPDWVGLAAVGLIGVDSSRLMSGWQMEDLEQTQRLQEIQAKLDQRSEAKVRDGGLFKPGELSRRRLVHEGTLFWKTPGSRLKGTLRCENISLSVK